MINDATLVEKELDILNQKYFDARSGIVKYLNFYISFCGLVATISSITIKIKPQLAFQILPLIGFGIILGLTILYSAVEATAIVIWSLYKINIIKKKKIKHNNTLNDYIKLDSISLYNDTYLVLQRKGYRKLSMFIKPFCYKNYREHIIIFLNSMILFIFLYIYQISKFQTVYIYINFCIVIIFICLQVRFYSTKFEKWSDIITSLQTDKF